MGLWAQVVAWWTGWLIRLGWVERPPEIGERLDLAPAGALVGEVVATAADKANTVPLVRGRAHEALSVLGQLGERLDKVAGDTPTAGVVEDGLALAELAGRLAEAVGPRGLHGERERALGLAAHAVLRVAGRDQARVGPRMLAWAEAAERIGRGDLAVQRYTAVVTDFAFLVDLPADAIDEDDVDALRALQAALARRVAIGGPDDPDLRARVAARLA